MDETDQYFQNVINIIQFFKISQKYKAKGSNNGLTVSQEKQPINNELIIALIFFRIKECDKYINKPQTNLA